MKEQTLRELFFSLIIAGHLYCDNLVSLNQQELRIENKRKVISEF
jgi:hypothetical protein